MTDPERSPLLPAPQREDGSNGSSNGNTTPVKRVGSWIARHAVVLVGSLLTVAVVVALAVFFGGKHMEKGGLHAFKEVY